MCEKRSWWDVMMDITRTLVMLMVMFVCPLMHGYAGRPEDAVSCDLTMLGWEPMYFSLAGAAPFVLVPIFMLGRGVLGRVSVRVGLLAVGLACYAYGCCLAEEWLVSVSDTTVTYEYGMAVVPLILAAAAAWGLRGELVKRSQA